MNSDWDTPKELLEFLVAYAYANIADHSTLPV